MNKKLDHFCCPSCGSKEIVGLVATFWVRLNMGGEIKKPKQNFAAEMTLTKKRLCTNCDEEFKASE